MRQVSFGPAVFHDSGYGDAIGLNDNNSVS
jgi:hypothetical protein